MLDLEIRPCSETDPRQSYVSDAPIDFETWLRYSFGEQKPPTELIKGVIVEQMAAQYPHEWIFAWLFSVVRPYVTHQKLGIVLGSRSAVKITATDGRLPDLLFVRAENTEIIQKDAIYGIPDLVIEIVSENDYPGILIPLENDYRAIGVPEIVFIDPKKERVRLLNKTETGYRETLLTDGKLEFVSIPGFWIEVAWVFADEKPDEFTLTRQLIEAQDLT